MVVCGGRERERREFMRRFRVVWRGRVAVFIAWPMEGEGEGGGDIVLMLGLGYKRLGKDDRD